MKMLRRPAPTSKGPCSPMSLAVVLVILFLDAHSSFVHSFCPVPPEIQSRISFAWRAPWLTRAVARYPASSAKLGLRRESVVPSKMVQSNPFDANQTAGMGASRTSIVNLVGSLDTTIRGDVENMIQLVESLEEGLASARASYPLTTFNHALIACAKAAKTGAGRMAVAYGFRVLHVMREQGVSPNIHTYTPLIDACAKVGALEESELAMTMMKEDGIAPNVIAYSSYIACFTASAAAGDRSAPSKVLKVLDEMREEGLEPNEYSYCSAVDACAAAAPTLGAALALKLGKLVIAAMRRDAVPGLQVAYNSLIKGCCAAVNSDETAMPEAFAVLDEMDRNGIAPNVVTYTSMVNMLAQAGDQASVQKALKLLDRMEKEGIQANIITYNVVLKACAKAARGGDAQRTLRNPGPRGAREEKKMSLDYSKETKEAKTDMALKMLDLAESLLATMEAKGLRPDVYSYNTLLNICASVAASTRQVPREGMRVLELMKGIGATPSAQELGCLLEAAQAAEAAGEADAMRVGIQLQHLLLNAKQPRASRTHPATPAAAPDVEDDDDGAWGAAREERGKPGLENVVGEAVVVDAGATWAQAAILHMNALTSSGLVDAAATAMQAKASLARSGSGDFGAALRFEAAKNVVTRMVDASATAERVKTLGKLSRVERRGAMEKCMALLEDMVRAGIEPDGVTLTTVINAGKQQGSPTAVSKAYRVFQLMNATSRTPRMYTAMISALGQGGFPEEALHVLEEAEAGVGGVEMTVETYTAALQALARSDQHRHLVAEVYQRMSDRGIVGTQVTGHILKKSESSRRAPSSSSSSSTLNAARGARQGSARGGRQGSARGGRGGGVGGGGAGGGGRRQGSARPDKRTREREKRAAERRGRGRGKTDSDLGWG